ncbi:SixA phosphatase family protein [Carbonactinospora thermoautotrophica]|uniref:SixA phosphatase family protein n=2 Tax=Carbonactinospora thermoautotrophica TaxID=1469144 RepID=UPI003DA80A35
MRRRPGIVTQQAQGMTVLRRLVLFRHAKADTCEAPDHERPLAARGRRDAPAGGRWLREAGLRPDRVVCSTARRTQETWALAAAELDAAPAVAYDERVYLASAGGLLDVLREVDDEVRTLVVVGHNPGLQQLALLLAGSGEADPLARARRKFPTSGLAVLTFHGSWSRLEPGAAHLADLAVPQG